MAEAQSGIFKRSVDLELRTRNCDSGFVLINLQQFQVTVHLETDILGLVNVTGIPQIERIRVIGGKSASITLFRKVAVQRIGCRSRKLFVRIVRHIMSVATINEFEDFQQRVVIVSKYCIQVVMERFCTLQSCLLAFDLMSANVQIVIATVERSAFYVSGCSEISEGEMPYRFTISGICIGSVIGIFRPVIVVSAISDVKFDSFRQLVDDGILAVITPVAGCLLGIVPVLINPDVTFNLNLIVHQGDRNRVRLLNQRISGVEHIEVVCRILECSLFGKICIIIVVLYQSMIRNDSSLAGLNDKPVLSTFEDNHESGDAFPVIGNRRRPIIPMGRCSPGSDLRHAFLHLIRSATNRSGVIPHRIHVLCNCNIVIRYVFEMIEDDIPLRLTVVVISHLRERIADNNI